MYQCCFNHVFVFGSVLDKTFFHFKNPSFGKYGIWFSTKFLSHKNGSNSLKYVLNFFTHICISKYYTETIFVDF